MIVTTNPKKIVDNRCRSVKKMECTQNEAREKSFNINCFLNATVKTCYCKNRFLILQLIIDPKIDQRPRKSKVSADVIY
jgi:hypothetical protein